MVIYVVFFLGYVYGGGFFVMYILILQEVMVVLGNIKSMGGQIDGGE